MQQKAQPKRGRLSHGVLAAAEQRQEPHLIKCSLALPISTRAVGMAVGRFMMELYDSLWDDLSSDEDGLPEGYVEAITPNLYKIYRLFLALVESKLVRVQRSSWPRVPGYVDHAFDGTELRTWHTYFPKQITELVNALGIVRHGDITFVPVVAEEFYDANGKLVPLPQSLLYSNLRRAVVALADPETPEQYRIEFEAYCPIPGAIWNNHLLMNADEIIPGNHIIESDWEALNRWSASLRGKLNDSTTGKSSALVNINKTRDFKMPPRQAGDSLLNYRTGVFKVNELDDKYTAGSIGKLTADELDEGVDLLMFGEVPSNETHKSVLYATRDEWISAYSYGGVRCLTLSVSTRGIGFYLSRFFQQNQTWLKHVQLNIYETYRAFLGLLEIKMKPYLWKQSLCETYKSSFVSEKFKYGFAVLIPESISRIINAVGNITIGQRTFVMAVAKERLDENGKLIPEPQNLLISNLRRTVEALSDPETPLQHREHFEQNCPIPGAVWDNHLLANADEILPPNYSADDLQVDINAWTKCARKIERRVKPHLTLQTINDGDAPGRRSAFVSVVMKHPMRVEPRQAGQELATYVPSVRSAPSQAARSFVWLTPEEIVEGQVMMLGERPKGETRPIYALRDPNVCGYKAVQKWNFEYRY